MRKLMKNLHEAESCQILEEEKSGGGGEGAGRKIT